MVGANKPKAWNPHKMAKRINILERELAQANKEIRGLKDILNVKNNWAAEISEWLNKDIEVWTVTSKHYVGTLLWIDRYNLAIVEEGSEDTTILQKGNIESMRLARRKHGVTP